MSAPHADQLIDGYLARIRVAATDLPAGAREELIADVRSHIEEARRREANETDASILNIIDRLGDPDVVVDEARQRPAPTTSTPTPLQSSNRRDVWDLVNLAVPGLLVFFAWPIGVILLWYSNAWSTRDKIIGTVFTLGGYPWSFALLGPLGHGIADLGIPVVSVLINLVLVLLPAAAAGYLTYQLRWGRQARMAAA
jgi:uncharacterized membrane protein